MESAPRRHPACWRVDTSASYWAVEWRVLTVGADNMAWDAPGYRDPELGCRGT
jgi:hypothetical protein